ncbi:MAG TPA: alpha-L-fucosidase [Acidobacteriaceae bacterium]|nr:alpha-L-fucosidase [Acidobacteriaceae bacterium]
MKTTRRDFVAGSVLALGGTYLHAREVAAAAPYGAFPNARQLHWQRMETYGFLHFGVNTFTNKEWGYGNENPDVFNPTDFDPDQIVTAMKAGGMKGVILTCKHHDGFCLWPTKTTKHSIAYSSWRNGKGDVVRDISAAARRHGIKFGVYVSPWDRNNAAYGTPAYLPIYRKQVTELLSNYGPVFEVWFDGANGGTGYYGGAREKRHIDTHTYYEWPRTFAIVRRLQPMAVIHGGDKNADIRWVGDENGIAGETCWATFSPDNSVDGGTSEQLMTGTLNGTHWMPAECDVSIRPGWFWHESQNSQVKTPQQLLDLYYESIGRGASLLLNVPPNTKGQLSPEDVASLKGFHKLVESTFADNLAEKARLHPSNVRGGNRRFGPANLLDRNPTTYWATDDDITRPDLTLDLPIPVTFNIIRLCEFTALGQRIESFAIDARQGGNWTQVAQGTSVGICRLLRLNSSVTTHHVRLRIAQSPVSIALTELGLYTSPE